MSSRGMWWFQTLAVYIVLVALTWVSEYRGAHAADRFQAKGFRDFSKAPKAGKGKSVSREKATFQKIDRVDGGYSVTYGFKNFNGDALRMTAFLDAGDVAQSIKEFGFRKEDFDKLDAWYANARKLAVGQTNSYLKKSRFDTQAEADRASVQAQKSLDRELAMLAEAYRKRRVKVYEDAGFTFKTKGVVEANIPQMVGRNWKRMRPLAQSFSKIKSGKGYDAEDLVGAVAAMVQTGMRYEIPDTTEGSRTIGGLLPPLKALVMGQGDCDTKTAVISSILMNWPNIKMVGLGIPGHYLMAYHRIPRRGDIFIEYKGLQYVMIESAGPAWLRPGEVGESTLAYLRSGKNFRIQPM